MTKKLRLNTANYCDKILRHHENQDENGDTTMVSLTFYDVMYLIKAASTHGLTLSAAKYIS